MHRPPTSVHIGTTNDAAKVARAVLMQTKCSGLNSCPQPRVHTHISKLNFTALLDLYYSGEVLQEIHNMNLSFDMAWHR